MNPIIDALKAWQLHPVADHFAISLVCIALLADLAASLFSTRMWIRYMALCLLILGTAGAWAAYITGEWEAERVSSGLSSAVKSLLATHAQIGEILPWVFLVLMVWRIGLQFLAFISSSRPIFLIVAILAVGAMFYEGSTGSDLVYTYGVGTAVMPAANVSPSPAPEASPSPAVPSPIPTVYAPTATPTPAESASPESTPTAAPSEAATPTPSPSPSPISSPSAAPEASPSPTASSSSVTPVNPPGTHSSSSAKSGTSGHSGSSSSPKSATL